VDTAADVDPDGNSINTQRDYCQDKARNMRVMLERKFIEMANKACNGGTLGLAKLGYLNARILVDGRKVNSIVVNQERAPFVQQAFELFATGQHTIDSLLEILTDAGFTAPGRIKPIARETLGRLLRDRYYIGKLNYKGSEYQGRHEPLIDEALFERVQRLFDSHAGSVTRERQHPHYLKGLVWCDRCKHLFTIMPGRGNGGTYFYFLCRGRQQKKCDHPYMPVDVMERAVEQRYARVVILPGELRAEVRRS
jgi:site-specific DNA recombinase